MRGERLFIAAATCFLVGVLLTASFFAIRSSTPTTSGPHEGLNVEGYATIVVKNPDGSTAYTWQGHNMLFDWSINDIAACISGNSSSSYHFAGCSGWTPRLYISWASGSNNYDASAGAANTLTPAGCLPASTSAGTLCDGWLSEATFGANTFTAANCGSCSVVDVNAGGSGSSLFDVISTSIPVVTGDSLLISIQFTVS